MPSAHAQGMQQHMCVPFVHSTTCAGVVPHLPEMRQGLQADNPVACATPLGSLLLAQQLALKAKTCQ
jgi:hypothetical protein